MANNILEMALEQLDFPPSTISAWFDDVTVVSFGDNRLVLHSPVPFKKEFIESKFIAPLQEVLHNLTGDPITIVVVTGEYTAPSTSTSPYDDYTFERFIVGSSNSNRFANAAAVAVAEKPADSYNPLFIYGNSGLGKTHLMYAIANVLRRTHPEYRIIYVKGEDFTNELITAIQEGNVQAFRNKYRMVDLLLLDDVQFIAGKNTTQEEFFNTFNTLHTSGRQIVISSDKPPKEIPALEERLRSRFEGGLITDIQSPDYETRMAILQKKADQENIIIDPRVLSLIATKANANIRQLEGAFTRVVAFSKLLGTPITLSMADSALKDIIEDVQERRVTVPMVQQVVADFYSVSVDAMTSARQTSHIPARLPCTCPGK